MRAKEIDIIRTLVILMLVLYHSFAPFSGGWDSMNLDTGVFSELYKWIGHIAYAGMLETFVAISGYVYAISEQKHSFTVSVLAKNKLRRLIIPALIWGCFYWLLFCNGTILSGSWRILNGVGHLWFLPMLFCCFILENGVVERLNLPFWLLSFFAIIPYPALPFHFNSALYYLVFFHLGFKLYESRSALLKIAKWSNLLYLLAFAIPLLIFATMFHDSVSLPAMGLIEKRLIICLQQMLRLLYSAAIVMAYFIVGIRLVNNMAYGAFKFIAACSFGIYLLQEFIIRFFYYYTDSVTYAYPPAVPWLGFGLGFGLSLAVVAVVRLSKFGRNIF